MASEVSKLKSIDLENTVVRNPRVGMQNRVTSRTLEAGATGINASNDIYTGERDVNTDYLIQGTINGTVIKGSGSLEYQDDKIKFVSGINGLETGDAIKNGDIVRMDGDTDFYGITGATDTVIYLEESNTSFTGPNPGTFQIRKNKLNSVYFEYLKSEEDENKFIFNRQKNRWTYTGVEFEGPVIAKDEYDNYIKNDPLRFKFLPSNIDLAPDLTHIDTTASDPQSEYGKKVLQSRLTRPTDQIVLNPIPYPDDNVNFKVYWGPPGETQLKEKDKDYTVNYTSDPDFSSAKPPYEERDSAYIFFMNILKDVTQIRSIGLGFEGIFTIHEAFINEDSDQARPVTNIFPNAKGLTLSGDSRTFQGEIIKVGNTVVNRFFDYNIEYGPGIVNFIKHSNLEPVVQAVIHEQDLIWDGVSVIKGVSKEKLKRKDGEDLVIPYGIGLTDIEKPMFFEDTEDNNLKKDEDYTFEYTSGAFSFENSLKPDECVLVSYFSEGLDVEKEKVDLSEMRTRKYPVIESSVSIKVTYSNATNGSTGIKVLIENVDFRMYYLTGQIVILDTTVLNNIIDMEVSYTPFAQINVILQPVPDKTDIYRMTIVDDVLDTVDSFNLKFKIKNPSVSIESEDPFDNEISYLSPMLSNSLKSVKAQGEPGYGLENLTQEQMYDIGITGLQQLGLDKKLNKTEQEFYALGIDAVVELGLETDQSVDYVTTDYEYINDSKEISLDTSLNQEKARPDLNDLIVATYSYEADTLPYAPVETIYPILNEGDDSFLIEGFDKTDTIRPGMVLRIDNLTPKNSYYFRINNVSYDGYNTTLQLFGSFPEDIVSPSFYVLDDSVSWISMPSGVTLNTNVSTGSEILEFSGYTLESLNLLRSNALLMVDNQDLYEILTTDTSNGNLIVNIFPALRNPFPQNIKVSPPIYNVEDTDIIPTYPLITDPEHPAFKIYYRQPSNAVYGYATIFIDSQKITLVEWVDGLQQTYEFKFSYYSDLKTYVNAIINTKSKLNPTVYNYYPFSITDDSGNNQYFLGNGYWSTDLIIPFEEDSSLVIPEEGYLVTISQEMFKYVLIRCFKGYSFFLIKEKDRRDLFSKGQLLAIKDKATNNIYFYEISSVGLEQEEVDYSDTPLNHTKISFEDKFRDNIVAPYIYKYNNVNWIDLGLDIKSVNYDNSEVSLSNNNAIRVSSVIKFSDKYVYQIKSVSEGSENTVIKLRPNISELVRDDQNVKISDTPIFLDSTPPQPYFPITYTLPENSTGSAYVESDDDKLTITEALDGSSERTFDIFYERYNGGLSQVASAIEYYGVALKGKIDVSIDTWKDLFDTGGNSLRLVPTQKKALSYTFEVSKPAIKIDYTQSGPGTVSRISMPANTQNILLYEWQLENPSDTEKIITIPYNGKTLKELSDAVDSTESVINSGIKPWKVSKKYYDSYYGTRKADYYDIIPFAASEEIIRKDFPYTINVTENYKSWSLLDILNRRVLTEDEDFSIEGTGVSLSRGIQPYERYELNYLGLDNLAKDENDSISITCRYFYSIPSGYELDVYMDFLNKDQYYIQKCTERRFLEIVTIPHIKQILQQAGNSVGVGVDNGSDNQPEVWDGGLVDLYYRLQDEKIKREIYLKIFKWYKQRLRNFGAEAQIILGFKFGHSSFVGIKDNGQFSLEDQYVEDENYTLTKDEDIDQIKNGFSKFFPLKYQNPAPKQYARFKNEYELSNEVYCYNLAYLNDEGTKVEKRIGKILVTDANLSDEVNPDTGYSDIDFDILPYSSKSSGITTEIERSFTFSFQDLTYGSVSGLATGINSIRTSKTNISDPDAQVFSARYDQDASYRNSTGLEAKEAKIPAGFSISYRDDDTGEIVEKDDALTIFTESSSILDGATCYLGDSYLKITFTEKINLYVVPYNKEEKTFRASHDNFKFLKRVSLKDEIRLSGKKNYYTIDKIEKKSGSDINPQIIYYLDTREEADQEKNILLYDGNDPSSVVMGVYTDEKGKDVSEPVYMDSDNGIKMPYYRVLKEKPNYELVILEDGKYFEEREIQTHYVKKIEGSNEYYYVRKTQEGDKKVKYEAVTDDDGNKKTIEDIDNTLPKEGQRIFIKRKEGKDFPVRFIAWDDEFNIGASAQGSKIIDHERGTDRIHKTFSFADFFNFPEILSFPDEFFSIQEGTYNVYTGDFQPRNEIKINLKYLNLREERRVSDVLEAIRFNLSGFRLPIVIPFPPFTLPPYFIRISNTLEKKDQRGADKYFYLDFDKYYDKNSEDGYEESLIFKARDRNSWFRFAFVGSTTDVTPEYGFTYDPVYTNFYYPNNLYVKLLLEKQLWLTEIAILKDLFDTNNKIARAFQLQKSPKNIIIDTGALTLPLSEFHAYLSQTATDLKIRLEAYIEHLRFLRDSSDTTHKYLVDNTSGPLYRTTMEDGDPSASIERSYKEAKQALDNYNKFETERYFYWDINNLNNLKWNKDYCRWSLSLEKGNIFQEHAKSMRGSDNYLDLGFWKFPGISVSLVDYGDNPPFVLTNPRYRITYNILPYTDYETDVNENGYLQIEYTVSGEKDTGVGCISGLSVPGGREKTEKCFLLKSYETLQDLVNAINSACLTPVSNLPVIRANVAFNYEPYIEYSTRWILKSFRAVPNNDANGSDSDASWIDIGDAAVDSTIYVGNVADHRLYDPRVLFMSRTFKDQLRIQNTENTESLPGHNDIIPTGFENYSNESITVWPYYLPGPGKELLGDDNLGPVLLPGGWSSSFKTEESTDEQDYTAEVNALEIESSFPGVDIIDYKFLDYSRGSEELPGSGTPRNSLYEMTREEIAEQFGYNFRDNDIESPSGSNLLNAVQERVRDVKDIEPQTVVIRKLQITLQGISPFDDKSFLIFEFEFDLRKNSTVNDLVKSINGSDYDSKKVYDYKGNELTGEDYTELISEKFMTATLSGSEDLQGKMRTVDLVTRYIPQILYVDSHTYYPEIIKDDNSEMIEDASYKTSESIKKNYQIGWVLREEGYISGNPIELQVDSRTYSPTMRYRFVPDLPNIARRNLLLDENKLDILAFDLYSWDDEASYKIEDNILYLRSATIPEGSCAISLLDESETVGPTHPEKRFKLIELIRKINENGVAKEKFFANLRFGRRSARDYEYTYLPDTSIWYGGDGWVPVQKAQRDTLYLAKDTTLLLNSEGSNAYYRIDPVFSGYLTSINPHRVYRSDLIHLEANTRAFKITPLSNNYSFSSTSYSVDQTIPRMQLNVNYETLTDGSTNFNLGAHTLSSLVSAIDATSEFAAVLGADIDGTQPATSLFQAPNNTLPNILYATYEKNQTSVALGPYSGTIDNIINQINSEVISAIDGIPTGSPSPITATNLGVDGSKPSSDLDDASGSLPVILTLSGTSAISLTLNSGSDYEVYGATFTLVGGTLNISYDVRRIYTEVSAINVSVNSPYSGRTYTISGGQLTLNWTEHASNTDILNIDLSTKTTIKSVVDTINAWKPDGTKTAFESEIIWIYPYEGSDLLLNNTLSYISSTGSYVRMQGVYEVPLYEANRARTIKEVVSEINGTYDKTGFSIVDTTEEYEGYKELPADYLVPVPNLTEIGLNTELEADFRLVPAIYVLNMAYTVIIENNQIIESEPATLSLIDNILTCQKTREIKYPAFVSNEKSYDISNKNLFELVQNAMDLEGTLEDSNNLSYATGILKTDIAFFLAEGIDYGLLHNRAPSPPAPDISESVDSIDLSINDPEEQNAHVYFGFLGDIRFWQISDYNIYRQYTLLKRRLGLPWAGNKTDYYVSDTKYDFKSFFYSLYPNNQFLKYLKYTRFGQLADSIRFEKLVENKYLWLYLKFHREIGCDQKAIYIQDRINQDEEKASQLS